MFRQNYILLILFSITGCAVSPTYVNDADLADNEANGSLNPVHYKVEDSFRSSPPLCVAIMPLTQELDTENNNETKLISDESLEQLRWSLYSQLAPYSYRDVELVNVTKALEAASNKTDYAAIGKKLNCDALLLSEVTDFTAGFFGIYSQSSIGIKMKLIRAKNEELLWKGSHIAKSHGGSIPLSPVGLVMGLYEATENLSEEQLIRVKDDVFRRLLSTWNVDSDITDADIQLAKLEATQESEKEIFQSYVSVHSLWLRSGPGKEFSRKGVLKQKDRLEILDDQHSPWVQVKVASGQLGYVNGKYLNSSNDAF